jgi:hypothetical protein
MWAIIFIVLFDGGYAKFVQPDFDSFETQELCYIYLSAMLENRKAQGLDSGGKSYLVGCKETQEA